VRKAARVSETQFELCCRVALLRCTAEPRDGVGAIGDDAVAPGEHLRQMVLPVGVTGLGKGREAAERGGMISAFVRGQSARQPAARPYSADPNAGCAKPC